MKHLDLFSGIGGFALAAQWVWGHQHEIHSFVEIEPFCQKVLKKHWPEVPIHDDIKTYKHDGTAIDLLTGGFPCQPFSLAGQRRGAEDDRALWPFMLKTIKSAKPRWIIGENVAGIINMELDNVLSDLEASGYEVWPVVVPACAVDAKHRRERVWIVGHSNGLLGQSGSTRKRKRKLANENPNRLEAVENPNSEGLPESSICQKQPGRTKAISTGQNVAHTQERRRGERHKNAGRPHERAIAPEERRGSSNSGNVPHSECNGLQRHIYPIDRKRAPGLRRRFTNPCWWLPEPDVGRVANGIPMRVDRLKSLGNAIVPQVVVPIMEAIKTINNGYNQALNSDAEKLGSG